tara:strand:+ start:192 stop:572 length:381 start_codon:yes stop_codon:yes gene_type:complete
MSSVLAAIVWAVVGVIFYKASSAIFSVGRYSLFAKEVVFHCLTLMGAVVEDLAFIRELKYQQLVKSDLEEEQIDFIKQVDEQALNSWKENSISLFKNSFPGPLNSIVKFNNWKEAMRELDKLHKTN